MSLVLPHEQNAAYARELRINRSTRRPQVSKLCLAKLLDEERHVLIRAYNYPNGVPRTVLVDASDYM